MFEPVRGARARAFVSLRICVRVSMCVFVWVVVADGCAIFIMLDDDACQCYRLLNVRMCTAL